MKNSPPTTEPGAKGHSEFLRRLGGARIAGDPKGPLFRSAIGKTGQLSGKPITRSDVWRMARRRASDAGIETAIGCHTFRATGITDYPKNGGRVEVAQRTAGHSNAKPLASILGATMT